VLTFNLALPETQYKTSASVSQFINSFVRRLEGEAGVTSAAAVFGLPLDGDSTGARASPVPENDRADSPSLGMRVVTSGYFETLRIPLRSGRTFDAHDDERSGGSGDRQ